MLLLQFAKASWQTVAEANVMNYSNDYIKYIKKCKVLGY